MKEKNILNTNLSFSVLTANIISLLLLGMLKLFPVQAFLAPVVIGVIVQSLFVEMAITWTSIAIAIAGVMTALKNEMIFKDGLTGLYNRVYLQFLQKQACKKKGVWISVIMIDLNSFKQINDNYGHSEGDIALIIAADLLRKSFSEYGVVTRYAVSNLGAETVDDFMNRIDKQMYQDKLKHYEKNDRRRR